MKSDILIIIGAILIVILFHLLLLYVFRNKIKQLSEKIRKELLWFVLAVIAWWFFVLYGHSFWVYEASEYPWYLSSITYIITYMGSPALFMWIASMVKRIRKESRTRKKYRKNPRR